MARPSRKNPALEPEASVAVAIDAGELQSSREYLLRVARRKLRDAALAEDAVHDVFEAVLSGRARFEGRSALRTWLTGILLHKVTDLQRQAMRYCQFDHDADGQSDDGLQVPCEGPRPDEWAEQRERLARVLDRMERLPAVLRDVLWWRVIHDGSTQDVCQRLGITADSMFVRLHRARTQLAGAA